jgi:hypothetical protein
MRRTSQIGTDCTWVDGCPQDFNRGACSNSVKERADFLEERLLSELENAVLKPEAIEKAIGKFEYQLKPPYDRSD